MLGPTAALLNTFTTRPRGVLICIGNIIIHYMQYAILIQLMSDMFQNNLSFGRYQMFDYGLFRSPDLDSQRVWPVNRGCLLLLCTWSDQRVRVCHALIFALFFDNEIDYCSLSLPFHISIMWYLNEFSEIENNPFFFVNQQKYINSSSSLNHFSLKTYKQPLVQVFSLAHKP